MQAIVVLGVICQKLLQYVTNKISFIGPVLLRIYLVPVFWFAANNKWNPFDSDSSLDGLIYWFGNTLQLPLPTLSAYLAWSAEYFGAILLALGLATRWICIPLMFTMLVAIQTVHIDHGWQAVHDAKSPYASEHVAGAIERLDRAREILQTNGNYSYLTEHGKFVILNSGIEWAATYFVMLLALFFLGGGRYLSLDDWIKRRFMRS